ncbi:unnamed protein product [Bathycoccus prasinos]
MGGRNEIALAVIGTALLMTSSSSVEAAQQSSSVQSSNQTPRRAAFVRTPITNHQRAQYLRRAQQQSTEQKRLQLERNAKQKLAASEKVERMQAEAKGKLGLSSASSKKKKAAMAEKDDEEEMVQSAAATKKEETDGMTTKTTTSSSSSSSSSSSHVKVHSHAAPKASELEEADEFESFNPLDLFAALEGTKKTPFEKQTTASGEVVENAVLNKKDKLSSVFATMLGSMMEVSRGVDESTGTTVSSNNSCVKATRNIAVSCFKEYSTINEDVKAGKLSADESTEKMELLRETCADKSRVINTQCVKPIAEMCSSQVQEIKKECAKGIVGSEELTLNKALDSASAAAQQCAAQASSLLKSCMKQSKTLSPDLKELAMIDSKAEERAKEMKKENEIQDKVNESMKDFSFSSSSSTLAQKEEEVVTMPQPRTLPQPGEQVEVVAASKPVIVARHHSSSLSKMKLPVVTEDVEEVEPAATTVSTTTPTQSTTTAQTLSVPESVLTTAAADATTTIEEQPEEEEEEKEEQQQPEETEEEQAVDEEADSGCAGALSKVTADCQLSYKQINDKVKSGEVEEAAGKEQIAVAARQCVAKTMLATSNCVDKVQRRRLLSLAK